MASKDKITIDTFTIISGAIAESDDLEIMANHICQLLVAALQMTLPGAPMTISRVAVLDSG